MTVCKCIILLSLKRNVKNAKKYYNLVSERWNAKCTNIYKKKNNLKFPKEKQIFLEVQTHWNDIAIIFKKKERF